MRKKERGYSLLVLIIAIAVILIITGGAISTLNTSMDERRINNFIYDINNIEEAARQYYSSTGTIPSLDQFSKDDIPSDMKSQLDFNDGDTYYQLDVPKLRVNNLHETDKTYVINEASLRVYMQEGIVYRGATFYTVTDSLMGQNSRYDIQGLDMVCTVSPTSWASSASIRVTIPGVSKPEQASDKWTLKYNIGPKDLEFFQKGNGNSFTYGQAIKVKTNGAYSIYVKDDTGEEYIKNVVVSNIDEYYPKYTIKDNLLTIMDDETGIKEIRYKVRSDYDKNVEEFKANDVINNVSAEKIANRTNADYYLLNGRGNTINSLKTDITAYKRLLDGINASITELEESFEAKDEETQEAEREQYEASMSSLEEQKNELKTKYAHILPENNTHYVLYVEDNAGNAIAIVEDYDSTYSLSIPNGSSDDATIYENPLVFSKICQTFNIEMPE